MIILNYWSIFLKKVPKEYEIFTTKLPIEFQNAIKTESIDEVNKEFAKLKLKMLKEYWKFSMNVVLSVSVAI